MSRAALVATLSAALAAAGAAAAVQAPPVPHDPPLVDAALSAMAEPVRRGIASYRELVDTLAASPADSERAALAQAYGQLGQLYHAHGATEAALAAYRNARRVDEGVHRWAYYAGALMQAAGDLAGAARELRAALELAPTDGPTLLRLGEVVLARRELEEAERRFRRLLELDPSSAAAWFGLGQVAAERRDAAAAAQAFERVLELQPDASIAHYPLALAYRDLGDAERARAHLALRGETVVRSPDPLLRELLTLGKLSALQVTLHQATDASIATRDLVGFAVGQLGDVGDAVDYLGAALERPDAPAAPLSRARVRLVMGALLVERGEPERAARELEAALSVFPDLAEAAVRLGNLLGRQGRYDDAIVRYDHALAREPDHAEALLGRADALTFLGRLDAALADLEHLERVVPGQGRIALRAASILERLGRPAEALARYREAAALPTSDPQRAAAHAGAGRVLAAQGDAHAAREAFLEATRLEPARAEHRLGLAGAAARLGLFAEAAAGYRAAADLDGGSEEARVAEVSALLMDGRWVEARARLEGATRVLPESLTVRHLLARLLAACPDPALRDGARAVSLAEALLRTGAGAAVVETLAMALAAAGRFDRAVKVQEEALASSGVSGSAPPGRIAANLERYRRREACCASEDRSLLLP